MNYIYENTPKSLLCVGSAFAFIGFINLIGGIAKAMI
jgi:uncharacterized membrane-anchored protein